ncbi:kinetochore Sim4 complex subunit FTA2-domain-containing protein [Hypomontagnella monticulosa]|nr:kinetochore Sim4 complex subunit FTA2-domain-containing protein [Hypomontagnella monticulosa]
MADLIPNYRGPKLSPFRGNIEDIQFEKLLGPDQEHHSSDHLPHSRVFQVKIEGRIYALKIFNFFSLDEIRPFHPDAEDLLTDDVVLYELDPFYAECRAFGLLVEKKKDNTLAVRCHGYVFLPRSVERSIKKKFGIDNWNRHPEDKGQPLRAIVKDYIRYNSVFGRKTFPAMRSNIDKLNKMGIYNMDIREENYRGGRLFDFSLAITSPHISLSLRARSKSQVEEDVRCDLKCFDELVEKEVERRKERLKSAKAEGRVRETRFNS